MNIPKDKLEEWLTQSLEDQDLDYYVTEIAVLEKIATIFRYGVINNVQEI